MTDWLLVVATIIIALATIVNTIMAVLVLRGSTTLVEATRKVSEAVLKLPSLQESIERQKRFNETIKRAAEKANPQKSAVTGRSGDEDAG